jgi:phospholipase/carboxylesterase
MHQYNILEKGKPLQQASKALLLLHGRGGTANDIAPLANEFCDEQFYIAAPHATNNTWYPYSFMANDASNQPWLDSAVAVITKLITDTASVIGVENIYLMGFSQGACLTLEAAAINANRYAGVVAFTGGLIGESINVKKYRGNFNGTKVFIGNSDNDPHVPLLRSKESKKVMENMGAIVTLNVYPNMPHTITVAEINAVKNILF